MRRRALIGLAVALSIVSGFWISVGFLVQSEALDRCVVSENAPPNATGGGIDYSPLLWRWTCVYSVPGGDVRRTMWIWTD